jgi:polysaccharide pyruvyl transferase CsaB
VKLAALGYYGFGNLGDEAVLAGIRAALSTRPELLSARLLALTADAAATRRLHPGVETVGRWRFGEAARALKGTDLFIFGGGSLLQDATSARSVVWYALMATIARRRSRRVLWWGQGIGPLHGAAGRRITGWLANQADAITVRDERSAALLKEVGARGSIEVVADPAFALDPIPTSVPLASVLVCLRHWPSAPDLERRFWESLPGPQAAVPMHLPDDRDAAEIAARHDWAVEGGSVETILGRFSAARLIIAMRLHALIFAARCGVPFVALSYDPKVDALARAAGQEDVLVPMENWSPESIRTAVACALDSEHERRRVLTAFAASQRERALRPAQLAAELLS